MIELVQHPMGLRDSKGNTVEIAHDPDGMVWAHSPALGLALCWQEGQLRFYNPASGRWLLTPLETEDARLAAEDARLAAEDARLAAEARAADLEAELRRLRGQSP